jgi:hypothetical protein
MSDEISEQRIRLVAEIIRVFLVNNKITIPELLAAMALILNSK